MEPKNIVLAVVAISLIGMGTATILNSYGNLSGSANVKAAVVIDETTRSSGEVTLKKNTDQNITSGDNMNILNATDNDGSVLNSGIEMVRDTKTVTVSSFNRVGMIELEIDENIVNKSDVS